ncbi:universal stress protein [Soehngenia longivitae]|uniref:Universal stress protein n=1 Tax=Soehngenia longivitae TaxID=2562294 RepID=A0A4Z0D9E2_9FIRM|nr:universal stress protein [Soehngenia longivitae]TFZ41473.1 universal stress protein [Soehngenia longivitae]
MKKILVPIDGSKCSQLAMQKAKELAIAFDSSITVITVVDSIKYLDMEYRYNAVQKDIEYAKELLKSAEMFFADLERDINTLYKTGDVAEEIVNLSEEGNFDLIVIGSRGMGRFSRAILGSVSQKVSQVAKTNVLIVKKP